MKKPVAYFRKGNATIAVLNKDGESEDEAIVRVAAKHGLDPSAAKKEAPENPPEVDWADFHVDVEEQAPVESPPERPKDLASRAVKKVRDMYENSPGRATFSVPPGKKEPTLPEPTDYGSFFQK